MARCTLPKDILWDMQIAGVLPFNVVIAGRLDKIQVVECTAEMAAWCRQESSRQEGDPEKTAVLTDAAEAIERALGTASRGAS
jgi:hypothetical protein